MKKDFKKNNLSTEPQKAAIGTNYSRVIPSKEINSKDRDSFWKKEEEEERKRVEGERFKQRDAKIELEKVRFRCLFIYKFGMCQLGNREYLINTFSFLGGMQEQRLRETQAQEEQQKQQHLETHTEQSSNGVKLAEFKK